MPYKYYKPATAEERRAVMQLLLTLGIPYINPEKQTVDDVDSYGDFYSYPALYFRTSGDFEMTSGIQEDFVSLPEFLAVGLSLKKQFNKTVRLNDEYNAQIIRDQDWVTITVGCQTIEHEAAYELYTTLKAAFEQEGTATAEPVHPVGERWRNKENGETYIIAVRQLGELGLKHEKDTNRWWAFTASNSPEYMTEEEFSRLFRSRGTRNLFEKVS